MNEKESKTKRALLEEIERLIRYDQSREQTINPSLLAYLDEASLLSIRETLLKRVGTLSDEDKEWLEQFKRYD